MNKSKSKQRNASQKMVAANVQDIISCGVCYDIYDDCNRRPRILSCGHSFCHSCLGKLLAQNPNCPTCKTSIVYAKTVDIPINFSLKSLINIRSDVICSSLSTAIPEGGGTCEPKGSSKKFLAEGHCNTHDVYNGMRCMDCEVWICGMCAVLEHKLCRTLLVAEAYRELNKQVSQTVEKELGERVTINEKLDNSLTELEEVRQRLVDEVRRKELELLNCKMQIKELKSLKSDEVKLSNKLKNLQAFADKADNDNQFSKTKDELDKLLKGRKSIDDIERMLEERTLLIPPPIATLHLLPQTLEELVTLCQTGCVYVMEDRYDGIKYGKVAVRDRRIFIECFQSKKVKGAIFFNFQELLSTFTGSKELPKTTFLQLKEEGGCGDVIEILIEVLIDAEGDSPRAKNFILLCSGLKGSSYKGKRGWGWAPFSYRFPGDTPVVDGIVEEDCIAARMKGGVYGMESNDNGSWFWIQLNDRPFRLSPKFGFVVAGLQKVIELSFKTEQKTTTDSIVFQCGLCI